MSTSHASRFWRSINELQNSPEYQEFAEREFPVAASEIPAGVSRRRWMQIMGASLALAGAGCRWRPQQIVPFAERPQERIPGEPQLFATSVELAGSARPLLATCYDGRPVKLEGNPDHPASRGASDATTQASLLTLYDPDRSSTIWERDGQQVFRREWADFEAFAVKHFERKAAERGRGVAVIVEPTSSLSIRRTLATFRERFPEAGLFEAPPHAFENELQGAELAFGKRLQCLPDFSRSTVIACFDADPLGQHPESLRLIREFTEHRDPKGLMNRLYVLESQYSITGASADHRQAVPSSLIPAILVHVDAMIRHRLDAAHLPEDLPFLPNNIKQFVTALTDDLVQHRGEAVLLVGNRQPPEAHGLAFALNHLLGNVNKTLRFVDDVTTFSDAKPLHELVAEIDDGLVDTLLIMGANPVQDAAGNLAMREALGKVATTIHLGLYHDETASVCTWHIPESFVYESWGDTRSWDGTVNITQPLIDPLLGGRSKLEVLAITTGDSRTAEQMVRDSVRADISSIQGDDRAWEKLVHDGFWSETPNHSVTTKLASGFSHASIIRRLIEVKRGTLELVFTRGNGTADHRLSNNGWLHETPDPLTKLVWDNAAIMSPATAQRLKVAHGQVIRLETAWGEVEVPAFTLPGQAEGSIGLALGYGRTACGMVAGNDREGVPPVGVDANLVRGWQEPHATAVLSVSPTDRQYRFATTQDHHAIDTIGLNETGRRVGEIVRETTWDDLRAGHEEQSHSTEMHHITGSLWTEPSYDGHAWGMAIDLNRCIGCNACTVACQAENNIPIVGKEQVEKGREMHWIRVDRYFTGDLENPGVTMQPVACHHCENAPCEQVCPVAATVHSDEGLNDMVYNRCIGTRYCANNCPYKVRRFNFFDYNQQLEEPNRQLAQLVVNPEVTVRSRGVMEKCTYCVQRIQRVKIDAANEERAIRDGEILTACQQACPARAIEFGDLNDQGSRVAKLHRDERSYGMLEELNVKPRTKYLTRVRNPNPALVEHDSTSVHSPGGQDGHH